MYPRTNYEMTQADLDKLMSACEPTPVMFLSGGMPMGSSTQENANGAWRALGERMGFDYMTVRPIGGKGMQFFSAVPSENETQRAERLVREAAEAKRVKIEQLEATISANIAELATLTEEVKDDKPT
jgi:hypothetical protein